MHLCHLPIVAANLGCPLLELCRLGAVHLLASVVVAGEEAAVGLRDVLEKVRFRALLFVHQVCLGALLHDAIRKSSALKSSIIQSKAYNVVHNVHLHEQNPCFVRNKACLLETSCDSCNRAGKLSAVYSYHRGNQRLDTERH